MACCTMSITNSYKGQCKVKLTYILHAVSQHEEVWDGPASLDMTAQLQHGSRPLNDWF